jgi:hypothetical protein
MTPSRFCQTELSEKLARENAIDWLEIAVKINADRLKEEAIKYIGRNARDLFRSPAWTRVISTNPQLMEEIFSKSINPVY